MPENKKTPGMFAVMLPLLQPSDNENAEKTI
jgi:hypothetical protein